eukprot:Skav225109  [mRNA]  locus=scaffold3770:21206:24269:+ [translate_table: standard]
MAFFVTSILLQCLAVQSYKIMLFWSVDSDARTIDLVKRNVAHARMQGGRDCCDVMLAHYQGGPKDWGFDWYNSQVKYTLVRESEWRQHPDCVIVASSSRSGAGLRVKEEPPARASHIGPRRNGVVRNNSFFGLPNPWGSSRGVEFLPTMVDSGRRLHCKTSLNGFTVDEVEAQEGLQTGHLQVGGGIRVRGDAAVLTVVGVCHAL